MHSLAEKELYYFMYDKSGSFSTALFNTIFKADVVNLAKLSLGYPEEVQAVIDYRETPDYWEDLCKYMKDNK